MYTVYRYRMELGKLPSNVSDKEPVVTVEN
jgi:hypothetical protein